MLVSIFVYEGQNWHEIVFVCDGRFSDESVYRRESMEIHEDNCDVVKAAWRSLDSFDEYHRLVPEELIDLLK